MSYKKLRQFYFDNYSIGYLNASPNTRSPFENRLVLISLICYITNKNKPKNPDITHYQVVLKVSDKLGLPDSFLIGLSIICEDFSSNCSEFPTFGLKGQDILKEIRSILSTYLPF